MGRVNWRDLLGDGDERVVVSPWLGGRSVRVGSRAWRLHGRLPPTPGWYRFQVDGRRAELLEEAEPEPDKLAFVQRGFVVGNRFVADHARVDTNPASIVQSSEPIGLVPVHVERFQRVSAGRIAEGAPLVYREDEFPLGPEDEVAAAFVDGLESVNHIPKVPPALDAAFRLERWRRIEARRRREQARREAERQAATDAVRELHGDGETRRQVAGHDFEAAATAALAIGGARYLDHRRAPEPQEMVVQFSVDGARFECSCDAQTLRIIDSGICLIDHETDERGDAYFTLESLPAVIRQARDEGRLVVFRHLD